MNFKISLAAVTGTSHEMQELPCQDKAAVERDGGICCAALADGAGSRLFSHFGAEKATSAVASFLFEHFDFLWTLDDEKIAVESRKAAVEAISENPYSLYDQACTLLFFSVKDDGRYISGHIGDGVQILVDPQGEMSVFSVPENGEYGNETWFITGMDALDHLRIRKGTLTPGSTLLMMSDGTAKSLYQSTTGQPAPACRTIARWLENGDETTVSEQLKQNMQQVFTRHSDDDMSIVVIRVQ